MPAIACPPWIADDQEAEIRARGHPFRRHLEQLTVRHVCATIPLADRLHHLLAPGVGVRCSAHLAQISVAQFSVLKYQLNPQIGFRAINIGHWQPDLQPPSQRYRWRVAGLAEPPREARSGVQPILDHAVEPSRRLSLIGLDQ